MAFEAYMKCSFTKQGASQGQSPRPAHKSEIPILRVDYQVEAPRDVATGKASGKRYHRPLTILKEWGASSPQFFAACWTNELISTLTLTFWQKDANGTDQQNYQITLTKRLRRQGARLHRRREQRQQLRQHGEERQRVRHPRARGDLLRLRQDRGPGHDRQDDRGRLVGRDFSGRRLKHAALRAASFTTVSWELCSPQNLRF